MNTYNKTHNSSDMILDFIKKNNLHKKEFAQMIGVTLSYVYNLTDNKIPFPSRNTTIERIATIMNISPDEFKEYKINEYQRIDTKQKEILSSYLKSNNMTNLQFIKLFKFNEWINIVDILRGVLPIPIDFEKFNIFSLNLKLNKNESFNLWRQRLFNILNENGMNITNNKQLLEYLSNSIWKYYSI